MRFKGLSIRVPRQHAQLVHDLLEMNQGMVVEDADPSDGPAVLRISIPEDSLIDLPGYVCEECWEWDGKHAEGCDGTCPDCGEPHDDMPPKPPESKEN